MSTHGPIWIGGGTPLGYPMQRRQVNQTGGRQQGLFIFWNKF